MQCKGNFEYPEGENWSTTAEAQKPSVAPKNHPIHPQTLILAFKARGSGRSSPCLPRLPFTSPPRWTVLFVLDAPSCSSIAHLDSLALNILISIREFTDIFTQIWRPRSNVCSSISICSKSNVSLVWVLFIWEMRALGTCPWYSFVLSVSSLPIRLKSQLWFLNSTLRMCSEHQWCSSTKTFLRKFDI